MHKVKLEQFEGPFDLLLRLIEKEKLDITEIALSEIADDYLRLIEEQSDQIKLSEMADFLVVAAKLLLIKSKFLLPDENAGAEGDPEILAKQLKIFKYYLDLGKAIDKKWQKGRVMMMRKYVPVEREVEFVPPVNFSTEKMYDVFMKILKKIEPEQEKLEEAVVEKIVSLEEKIVSIKKIIDQKEETIFSKTLKNANSKQEIIVSFLAMLELVKQREIYIEQLNLFEEIKIKKFNPGSLDSDETS